MASYSDLELSSQPSIQIPQSARDWPLAQVPLSVRLEHVLQRIGCKCLGDLHGLTYNQVLKTHACGKKTIEELQSLIGQIQSGKLKPLRAETTQSKEKAAQSKKRELASTSIFIPQNARGWPVAQMPISNRLAGVLQRMGANLLGDLHGVSFGEVWKRKNCGRQTVEELEILVRRVQSGDFDQAIQDVEELDLTYLVLSLNEAIGKLSLRERDMLLKRLGGLGDKPMTLEEISATYDLTRERVRQIVDGTIIRAQKSSGPLVNELLKKLAEKCLTAVCPLTPELFGQWIGPEISVCRFPASFYIRLFGELAPDILPAWPEGQKPSSQVTERSLQIIKCLRELLRGHISPLPLSEAFKQLRDGRRPPRLEPSEFLRALKRDDSLIVDFVAPDAPTVRPAKLKTVEWAHLVLSQAERPLTPEEIIERTQKMLGDSFTPGSPLGLANVLRPEDGFYLLDRRAFGLKQHIRLPKQLWNKVRSDCYQLLRREDRPVSTAEVVNERRFDWGDLTNAYEVAQILREDKRFVDLGRFLFALAKWGIEEREHVNDLIPKVLAQAGHPVNTTEIVKELQLFRSVTATSMSVMLRKHPNVREYGFGYYGLRQWDDSVKSFLVSESLLVNRVIARSEPPLTFGDLCRILEIPAEGQMAERLWQTVQRLPKVARRPEQQALETLLSHRNWSLERALQSILVKADQPMPAYEIQWELNDRFGQAFGNKSLIELEQCLQQSRLFVHGADGRYLLASQLENYGFDLPTIRQTCLEILADSNEIVGCDDLLERLEAEGVEIDNLSPKLLAALLRGDDTFDEIGTNRFRVTR